MLMGSDINTKAWETHGALSADGNTFYFVSDRKGGYGGRDLYRVVRLPRRGVEQGQNLGPNVNTKYDEDGAFIHPNGRTLYFAPSAIPAWVVSMSSRRKCWRTAPGTSRQHRLPAQHAG